MSIEKNRHETTLKPVRCHKCNSTTSYMPEHDAFYCKQCDVWAVKKCGVKNCAFCRRRPAKPSKVKSNGRNNNDRGPSVSAVLDNLDGDEIMRGKRWGGGMAF